MCFASDPHTIGKPVKPGDLTLFTFDKLKPGEPYDWGPPPEFDPGDQFWYDYWRRFRAMVQRTASRIRP
jgi:hypothetical protein